MFHTGIDPESMQPVQVATRPSDRGLQRALLQFFLPENYFYVKKALTLAGREDLIGDGPECLIPAQPGRLAREARAARADAMANRTKARDQGRSEERKKPAGYRWAARRGGRS
jgi:hypothetical protein